MKYHGHILVRVPEDLGEQNPRLNCVWKIYKDGKMIDTALTSWSAKNFIDSGYNQTYL